MYLATMTEGAKPLSNNLSAELAAQTSSVTESRTLALTDNGMVLNCNSGSAIVLTIPPASSVVWSGVSCVAIYQAGAGALCPPDTCAETAHDGREVAYLRACDGD